MIVKPAIEDGSAGITEESVVDDETGLKKRVRHVIERYGQEALAEEYVGGREVNVGVPGHGTAAAPAPAPPPFVAVGRVRRGAASGRGRPPFRSRALPR